MLQNISEPSLGLKIIINQRKRTKFCQGVCIFRES